MIKKAVRTALFSAPNVYERVSSAHRYTALHRVGLVHERVFRALPIALNGQREPVVVDVGGNLGQSVLSLYSVLPDARVMSFEPCPGPLTHLRKLQRKFPSLQVQPYGLANRNGRLDLFVPAYRGKRLSTLASFDYEEARSWISKETVYKFNPSALAVTSVAVEVRILDDFHLAPDVVKIDVQGFEEEVVEGGERTIRTHLPVLIIESPPDSLCRKLRSYGYEDFEYHRRRVLPPQGRDFNRLFIATSIRRSRS